MDAALMSPQLMTATTTLWTSWRTRGRGVCSCTDHRCRCQPKLNRGDKAITYSNTHTRTQCKHIDKLIKFFGLTVLRTLDTDTIESLIEIHGDINRVVEHLGITVWCRLNNKQPTDLFEL
jgi:hypothetical protein